MTPRVRLITAVLSCVLALVTVWVMLNMATDAKAVNGSTSGPPRGGCAMAWEHPHSAGADWCRDHGWTIRVGPSGHGIVTSPHAVVRYEYMHSCNHEDGSGSRLPCSWNLHSGDGNGEGNKYWFSTNHRIHFVWSPSPLHAHPQWQWVDSHLGAELWHRGLLRYRDDWLMCAVKFRVGHDPVQCADGLRIRL